MTLWIYSLIVSPGTLTGKNNNCMHVQQTFFNLYLPTTTTTRRCLILRFMEDNIEQQQTGVRLHWTRSVSWNSRDKDWKNANLLVKRSVSRFAALDFNNVPTIQRKQGIKLQSKKSALFKVDQLCQSDVHQRAMVGAIGTRKINPPFRHNFGLSYDNFTP